MLLEQYDLENKSQKNIIHHPLIDHFATKKLGGL